MKTIKIKIQNLKCGGCSHTITTKLSNLDFVKDVNVNNDNNTVTFSYNDNETLSVVKKMLVKLGYPEIGNENVLTTKAKSFVSCAMGRISK